MSAEYPGLVCCLFLYECMDSKMRTGSMSSEKQRHFLDYGICEVVNKVFNKVYNQFIS